MEGLMFGFDMALIALKTGQRVARAGWNGKGMSIVLVKTSGVVGGKRLRSFLEMTTVDDELVPWVASQTDLLADDWHVVE
jgi:hypothetical protein